jgi:hypothetical protein
LNPDERQQTPAGEPLNGRAHERSADGCSGDERDATGRAGNGFRDGKPRADTSSSECAADAANQSENGDNRQRLGAARSGDEQQPARGAGEYSGNTAAGRGADPTQRDGASGASKAECDQLS